MSILDAPGLSKAAADGLYASSDKIPSAASDDVMVPLAWDNTQDPSVALWLQYGLLGATGIAKPLADIISAFSATYTNSLKTSSDGRTLFKYRAAAGKLRASLLSQVKVLITGDSWAELPPLSQAIADRLYNLFGKSADGWFAVNSGTNTLNGMTSTLIGAWTQYDASTAGLAPTNGCGIDGRSISTTATDARWLAGNVTSIEVEIFYQDLNGYFEYKESDSGTWKTVTCTNTGATLSVKITSMANIARTVEVRTTAANTGTVCIHGMYFTRDSVSGAILNKCGNSGSIAQNLAVFSSKIGYYATKMNPDIVVIVLGTNDYRVGVTVADFERHLTTLINVYRAAVPNVGIILLAPAQTNGVATIPLVNFRSAMVRLSAALGCEFYSLYDEFGTWTQMNALGQFDDDFHLGTAGAQTPAGRMSIKFFSDR
jgi:lysophospholipase L1-like esterase